MAHEDKGHYAAKHKGRQINETIAKEIQALSDDNIIKCARVHGIGKQLNIAPSEIGVQTDLLEYRIADCQLGLFGYSDGKKRFDPDIEIAPDINELLDKKSKNGRERY